jgi:Protein of unknown function (DUF3048) N-terminal domain/Protein of unknown function (DUF3048) C-terminal domain
MLSSARAAWRSVTPARRRQIVAGVVTIAFAGGVLAAVLPGGSTRPAAAPRAVATTTTTLPAAPTTTTLPRLTVAPGHCPLTDVYQAAGVPQRPALGIKIGNEPYGARPQSGLNEADIVFDTPAEGFIMRYLAVYQCSDAAKVGPNRSVRWVDWHLMRQFRNPILAYAGGIGVNLNLVGAMSWLQSDNLLINAAAEGFRTSDRQPPDNLYTSTSRLYAFSPAFVKKEGVPDPVFSYSAEPSPASKPIASARINFSYDTDAIWTWSPASSSFIHSYSDGPDVDTLTNTPVSASNVLILICKYRFGRYAEHIGGSGDFESVTIGSGSGYLLRDGRVVKLTWERPYVTDYWILTGPDHERLSLAPGRTWVEIVPNTTAAAPGALTLTP